MPNKLFMGNALCAVDSHGGILLPEFVRVPLAVRSDATTILLGSHETDPCLVARDPLQAIQLQLECRRRRIAEEASRPDDCHARARRIFGLLQAVSVDAAGRCALPELLRRRGRIRDDALIVGTGEAFEVWSPQVALYGQDTGLRTLAALSLDVSHAA